MLTIDLDGFKKDCKDLVKKHKILSVIVGIALAGIFLMALAI